MNPERALSDIIIRARRAAIICDLLDTIPDSMGRKALIMKLWEAGIITAMTSEMLIEHYHLEAA